MESALVDFVQSLIDGGDVDQEVCTNVVQNFDPVVMFGNAANWLGIMGEGQRLVSGMGPINTTRNRVQEHKEMAVKYHILVESMGDTGRMPLSFKVWRRWVWAQSRIAGRGMGIALFPSLRLPPRVTTVFFS